MSTLYLVYEDEGFGPYEPTLHGNQRDALLEALYRLGDDMDEAVTLEDAKLEERLVWLNNKITDFQACIAEGSRQELETMFLDTNMEIPLDIEPSFVNTSISPAP